MTKILAVLQLLVILSIVGFSTYQLFQGRFEVSLSLLPVLLVYYVFITARRKKHSSLEEKKDA
jgi:hypothetical protein